MALITEQDRIKEFENIKEFLEELEVAAEILQKGGSLEESCLLLSMPTETEELNGILPDDLHMATAYLTQTGDEEDQLTKYLTIYMPIQVDLTGADEGKVLKYVNDCNESFPFGTCFYGENPLTGRMLVQVKWSIGGPVDELLDEGVVCEAIFELGCLYDLLKEELLEMKPSFGL